MSEMDCLNSLVKSLNRRLDTTLEQLAAANAARAAAEEWSALWKRSAKRWWGWYRSLQTMRDAQSRAAIEVIERTAKQRNTLQKTVAAQAAQIEALREGLTEWLRATDEFAKSVGAHIEDEQEYRTRVHTSMRARAKAEDALKAVARALLAPAAEPDDEIRMPVQTPIRSWGVVVSAEPRPDLVIEDETAAEPVAAEPIVRACSRCYPICEHWTEPAAEPHLAPLASFETEGEVTVVRDGSLQLSAADLKPRQCSQCTNAALADDDWCQGCRDGVQRMQEQFNAEDGAGDHAKDRIRQFIDDALETLQPFADRSLAGYDATSQRPHTITVSESDLTQAWHVITNGQRWRAATSQQQPEQAGQ